MLCITLKTAASPTQRAPACEAAVLQRCLQCRTAASGQQTGRKSICWVTCPGRADRFGPVGFTPVFANIADSQVRCSVVPLFVPHAGTGGCLGRLSRWGDE